MDVNAAEIPELNWEKYGLEVLQPERPEVPEVISEPDASQGENETDIHQEEEAEKGKDDLQEQKEPSDVISLKDEEGFEFTVKFHDIENPTDEMLLKLSELKKKIKSSSLYRIRSLHFLFNPRVLDAHVKIDSFQCGDDEYASRIPAGIFFSQNGQLKYNFRLVRGNYFIRIAGAYRDDESICEKISSAVENPAKYLNRNDPAFVSSRVEILEKEIERLENESWNLKLSIIALYNRGFFSGPKRVDPGAVSKIVSIKKRNPHMSPDEIYGLIEKEDLQITKKELELVLQVFFPVN